MGTSVVAEMPFEGLHRAECGGIRGHHRLLHKFVTMRTAITVTTVAEKMRAKRCQ